MKQKNNLFFIYLFFLSCLGQISSDLYLPAMPVIKNAFRTSQHDMQLSLALFMLSFSVSHLIYGPISDNIGRKKPLIIGTSIAILGTLLCFFSQEINLFMLGRLLQGAGVGAGATLFLSILRDRYQGNELAKIGSFFTMARVILLASAPLIGSYLLMFFDWRACFLFLLIYTGVCLAGSIFILRETNPHVLSREKTQSVVKNIILLCTHSVFMSHVFCAMFAFGGILAWLTTLPFLLQDVVGLTPVQFGWIVALSGLFFIVGGFINAMMVERFHLENMLRAGLFIMLIASIVMLFFGIIGKINTFVIMTPVIIYIIGSSFVFSNAYAGAMHPFPDMAGTAGALFGFLQILGGAISSVISSILRSNNQIPLALVLLCTALLALWIQYLIRESKLFRRVNRNTNKIRP